jgi:hypothetical protein
MFGAPEDEGGDGDDAPVEAPRAPVAPAPRFDPPRLMPLVPVPVHMPGALLVPVASRRTLPLDVEGDGLAKFDPTTRLPDGVDALVMGASPDGGIEVHRPGTPRPEAADLAAVVAAPVVAAAAVALPPVVGAPEVTLPVGPAFDAHDDPPWPLIPDQRGGTGPRPEPVLPTDRFTTEELEGPPRPWRRRILFGAAAVSVTLVLGTVTALLLVSWIGGGDGLEASRNPATKRAGESRASDSGERLAVPAPAAVDEPARGPALRPIEPRVAVEPSEASVASEASEASVVAAPGAESVESSRGDAIATPIVTPPVPSVVPVPSALPPEAPEPTVVPRVAPGVTPATPDVPPAASTATPKPKPKPAPVVMVPVEVRNSLIKPGIEVMIGKKKVTTTGSIRFEIAAGRHRVKWREVGTTAWIDAGKFELATKRSHLFVIGKISYPHGVRHVPQEIR